MQRPTTLTVLGILNIAFGALGLLGTAGTVLILTFVPTTTPDAPDSTPPLMQAMHDSPFLQTWSIISVAGGGVGGAAWGRRR